MERLRTIGAGTVFFLAFLLNPGIRAEQIDLEDGSKLLGSIKSWSQGKIVFDTAFGGEITVREGDNGAGETTPRTHQSGGATKGTQDGRTRQPGGGQDRAEHERCRSGSSPWPRAEEPEHLAT